MKVAVLGTGSVGRTLAAKLGALGHDVRVGSRTAGDDCVPFAEAAAFAEVVVNATAGPHSLDALTAAGTANLAGKLLVDVANPLDFSAGFPPTLSVCNDDSLAESIQRAHPAARVVKTLNTVNAAVMVEPSLVAGDHAMFVCGEDDGAKAQATELLASFGWPPERVIDLGGIESARGMEMYVALWTRLYQTLGTAHFNVTVAR